MSGKATGPSDALRRSGAPDEADLARVRPDTSRLAGGPAAVLECFQRIPCDPCASSCRRGAIAPFADINDLPALDRGKCNGCGLCVARCPGLAIFVVDETFGPDEALIKMAYEFLPLPAKDQVVSALDREGRVVGRGRVVRVLKPRTREETAVVWVAVPKNLAWVARNIKVEEDRHG
ncbi:MAG TPA: 4Fe-4S binding protein [Bacillota bacterium]|jgi:Fe-S-cluster-containing hydrogenase component 2